MEQPTAEILAATATAYLEVFTTLDPNTIASIQTDNYKHVFAPASLNPPEPFTREGFATHVRRLQGIMRSFPVRVKEMWPNPSLKQVVIWTDSETSFHDHVKDSDNEEEWKVNGEYIWILTMDQSGRKVEHVLEFLDSKVTESLRAVMGRAFKKLKSSGVEDKGAEGGW